MKTYTKSTVVLLAGLGVCATLAFSKQGAEEQVPETKLVEFTAAPSYSHTFQAPVAENGKSFEVGASVRETTFVGNDALGQAWRCVREGVQDPVKFARVASSEIATHGGVTYPTKDCKML